MLRTAFLALAAFVTAVAATQTPALADDRIALAQADSWDLSLYETGSHDDDGGLPGGGLAFSLNLEGMPNMVLALHYSDDGTRAGDSEGLGLLATVDLLGGGSEDNAYLRLSYRASESSIDFSGAGSGGAQQIVALRAGLTW